MKQLITSVIAVVFTISTYAQTTWNIDPSHSKVNFSITHLVISEVDGTFKTFNGNFSSKSKDFSNSKINFEIDANSINTDNEKRDGHLKSEDFFHTKKHPKITFKSTSFKKVKGNKYLLKGNLTMRGVTKPVTLNVKHGGIAIDGYGNTRAGFTVTGEVNRIDYGIAWNAKTEHGSWTLGEDVSFIIKLELIKSK